MADQERLEAVAGAPPARPRLGTYVEPRQTPNALKEALEQASLADELGYDSIWLSQLANMEDGPTLAASYCSVTERVGIGVALVVIYSRHPTSTVQMATTLDSLSNGRFRLGLSVGHDVTVNWMWGLRPGPPVTAMREYVSIVRQSVESGTADVTGDSFTARWVYHGPRRAGLPILIGAIGPKMLELAGELGDGVLLWLASPAYIRDFVVPHVALGRARAGLGMEGFEVQAGFYVCMTHRVDTARDYLRKTLAFYSRLPPYRRMLEATGLGQEFAERRISDATLMEISGIGSGDDIREAVERYRQAGCTLPVMAPFPDRERRVPLTDLLRALRP